jgi:hypothetical protein
MHNIYLTLVGLNHNTAPPNTGKAIYSGSGHPDVSQTTKTEWYRGIGCYINL